MITPAAGTTFHGTLTDKTTGHPLAGRTITIVNTYSYMGEVQSSDLSAVTDSAGNWSVPVTIADAPTRMVWRAFYSGDAGISPSGSGELTLVRAAVLDPGRHGDLDGKLLQRRPRCDAHREGAEHAKHGGKTADRADARRDRDGVEVHHDGSARCCGRHVRCRVLLSPRPAGSTCGSATPARRKGRGRARFRRKSCSSSPEP